MNNNQRIEKKQSNSEFHGLLISIIIFFLFLAGLIVLIVLVINNDNNREEETPDVTEVQYNKLLQILNSKIDETKVAASESVNSVTTFMYKDSKFHIVGYNNTFVYDLSLSVDGYSDEVGAYNYIISDSTTSYVLDYIDRYDVTTSDEFNNKYLTSDYTYKAAISSIATYKYVYMTRMNNTTNEISVMCRDNLNYTLQDNYVIKTINTTHQLYGIYKFIATN